MRYSRLVIVLVAVCLFVSSFSLFFSSPNVKANHLAGEWVDAGHIKYDGRTYIDREPVPFDSDRNYNTSGSKDPDSNCLKQIDDVNGAGTNGDFRDFVKNPENGSCPDPGRHPVNLNEVERQNIVLYWVDKDTMRQISDLSGDTIDPYLNGSSFKWNTGVNKFIQGGGGDCHSSVTSPSGQFSSQIDRATLTLRKKSSGACVDIGVRTVGIGDVDNKTKEGPGGGGSGDNETEPEKSCNSAKGPGKALGFFLCPLVDLIVTSIEGIESHIIKPFLEVNPLSESESAQTIKTVWSSIRTLANVLFIIAFLVIIFSQALSLNVDAYQIKRMLPRLLIASIAVQISFFISGVLIDIFNILGEGIGSLLLAPLKDANIPNYTFNGIGDVFGIAGAAVAIKLIIFSGGAVIAPLIGILIGAAVVVLAIGLILALRQIAIVALVMISPIAFVAMVLPNTEPLYKKWQTWFIRLGALYPAIIVMFAGGKIVGAVASIAVGSSSDPDSATFGTEAKQAFIAAIGLGANVAVVFLLPAFIKLILGAAGGIMNLAQGKGKEFRNKTSDARDPFMSFLNKRDDQYLQHKAFTKARKASTGEGPMGKLKQFAGRHDTATARVIASDRAEGVEHAMKTMEQFSQDRYTNRDFAMHGATKEDYEAYMDKYGNPESADYDPTRARAMEQLHEFVGNPDYVFAASMTAAKNAKTGTYEDTESIGKGIVKSFKNNDGSWRGPDGDVQAARAVYAFAQTAKRAGVLHAGKGGIDRDGEFSMSAEADGHAGALDKNRMTKQELLASIFNASNIGTIGQAQEENAHEMGIGAVQLAAHGREDKLQQAEAEVAKGEAADPAKIQRLLQDIFLDQQNAMDAMAKGLSSYYTSNWNGENKTAFQGAVFNHPAAGQVFRLANPETGHMEQVMTDHEFVRDARGLPMRDTRQTVTDDQRTVRDTRTHIEDDRRFIIRNGRRVDNPAYGQRVANPNHGREIENPDYGREVQNNNYGRWMKKQLAVARPKTVGEEALERSEREDARYSAMAPAERDRILGTPGGPPGPEEAGGPPGGTAAL